jgi:hypothetical protein
MNESTEHKRRHFSDDQKVAVVRRHLGDKVPISDLADEYPRRPAGGPAGPKERSDRRTHGGKRPRKKNPLERSERRLGGPHDSRDQVEDYM